LVDPGKGGGWLGMFADRIEELIDALADAGQTRLPGNRPVVSCKLAAKHGIWIQADMWNQLLAL
jgi:delta1-piperideine-2-carboxylate reductase